MYSDTAPVEVQASAASSPSPDKVHMIRLGDPARALSSNCFILQDYIVKDKKYEFAMIDTGNSFDVNTVTDYIKAHNITHLRYLFITHYHGDHYGGLAAILKIVTVGTIVLPTSDMKPLKRILLPDEYTKIDTALKKIQSIIKPYSKMKVFYMDRDRGNLSPITAFGDGKFTYYNTNPAGASANQNPPDNNNRLHDICSLVILYETHAAKALPGIRYLFTGDIWKLAETKILMNREPVANIDVLQLSHHGSSNASDSGFLTYANPKVMLCSRVNKPTDTYAKNVPQQLKKTAKIYGTYQQALKADTGNALGTWRASSVVIENRADSKEILGYLHKVYNKAGTYARVGPRMNPGNFGQGAD